MNSNQLEKYLRNRILVEIKANSLRKRLTEDQIGNIAIYLASDDNLLTEGFFSTIGALLGGGMTETKRFLAKRVVSFLGIPSGHPLSQPVTDFIARLPTKDIYAMYRGNPRMRKKLVSVLSDATVNAFKQEMPNIMALKGGSLGGPITDAMVDVVSTKEFKQSVKKSFEDALVNLPGSDAGDLAAIKQDIEDLKKGVADITQSLKKKVSPDKEAAPEAPDEMPTATKKQAAVVPPADEEPTVVPTAEEAPAEEAEKAAEEAAEAAVEAEEAEAVGDEVAAEEAAEDAKEAAEKAEDAVEGASDVEAAEAAAEEARKKARKAEASKLRIPMRDFIKAKLNLDNDLGRYDPRISLEDLQAIHDNFLAAETDQQRLAAIETFARAKTFEELTKLIGAPDAEAPVVEPEEDIEEPAEETPEIEVEPTEEVPEPEAVEEPEEVPEPEAEAELEADASVEDAEADAADAKADDLERAAENEPENKKLQKQATSARAEADKERTQADKAAARARSSTIDVPEYELALDPKAESERKKLLTTIEETDPGGNIDLYVTNLNKYLDSQIDRFFEEAASKAPKAKVVKDGKKTEQEFVDEYVPKQASKLLKQITAKIKESGSTAGLSYIFGRASQEQDVQPEEEETKTGYNQVNVELYDDKTVVLSDRSTRGKLKRSKIGEGVLSEVDWSTKASKGSGPITFRRKGVSVVELPPVSLDRFPKIRGWGMATSEQKKALTDEIYNLLKQKSESDPEAVEDFDLGSSEETGRPNLVIMGLSTPSGERDKWSGVFDHRSYRDLVEDIPRELGAFYKELRNRYIYQDDVMDPNNKKIIKHKKGEYNDDRAFSAMGPMDLKWAYGVDFFRGKEIDHTKTLNGKKLLALAEFLGIEEKDLAYLPRLILVKTGDLQPEEEKADQPPEPQPKSAAPEMTPDELADLDDEFERSLASEEDEEEVEGLEEIFNISDDLLRELLA